MWLLYSGILIAAKALLDRNNDPTESEVRYWLLEIFVDALVMIKLLAQLWKQPKIFGRQRDG